MKLTDNDYVELIQDACEMHGWELGNENGGYFVSIRFKGGFTRHPCYYCDDPNIKSPKGIYRDIILNGRALFPEWAYRSDFVEGVLSKEPTDD